MVQQIRSKQIQPLAVLSKIFMQHQFESLIRIRVFTIQHKQLLTKVKINSEYQQLKETW